MADDKWSSLTFATNNTSAIKGFLSDIDGCIKVVKQLAQLAQSNVAFLQLLLTGLANPFFIAIQVLCQAIEDYVNSLFNVGIYYMIVHSGNTDLERVAKFKETAEFKYPGQLLQDVMAIEDTSVAYEMLQMAMRINSALPDSQKVRDAERIRRPDYISGQFLKPYEIAAKEYVSNIGIKTAQKLSPAEKKNIALRYIYNGIKDDVFIVKAFVKKYGSKAKAIIAEREGKSDLGNITEDEGINDGVLGTTARATEFLFDSGLAYVGRKAEALGLTQLSPGDVLDAMGSALNDKGDFNRPGAPLFELHTSEDKEGRKEERIKNPQNYYFAKSQQAQLGAILNNTAATNKGAVKAKLDAINASIGQLEGNTETVYGELGKPKRDKFGRPKLFGYNAGSTAGTPFKGSDFGFFKSVPYEQSLDQELDSGFSKYSGAIFYVGAATIDSIPTGTLELLGRVFNGFDKYFSDLVSRINMAFGEHTKQRSIHLRNVCQVVASKPTSAAAESNPFFPKSKVDETFFKIEDGTILIGETSKNTVIVIKNERTEREDIIAVDDRGNVYNPYSSLTATMDKNKKVISQDNVGGFATPSGDTQAPEITFSQDSTSSYSAQRLRVMPYTNAQGKGKYEPIEGLPFQPGELVYVAIEDGSGTIDINREVVGADIKSCVLGTFNTELGEFGEYEFPPSIAPDFAPKITAAEFFPDFAFAVRNTILGFTQFLRGLAKGGANALSEIVQLLDDVIQFLKDLESGIVRFLVWLQSLAQLADSGIYAVTFSANGKAGLQAKLDELKTADGAPPGHLKYSFAVLLLGAESDFNAFLNFLNTNQAFKNFDNARKLYGGLLEQSLKGFEEDIKDQLSETLRRGRHFQSMFQEDTERNSDLSKDLAVYPDQQRDGLLTRVDTSAGGTDKFDNGGRGKEGSGGFVAESDAENALLNAQQAMRDANGGLTNNILDASLFGFDTNQMRDQANKLKFFWRFDVERLTATEERSMNIVGYRLYWARSEQDEFENISYQRVQEIHTFVGNGSDFVIGVDQTIPLTVEVPVGANEIPKGTTHVLLCTTATVISKLGNQTYGGLIESDVFHAIPISTTLPIEPEVIVDETVSSVSLGELFITNLTFTIDNRENTGTDGTSTVLGYRVFFGDSNLKDITTTPFRSYVLPADGGIMNIVLENVELSEEYAGKIENLLVYAENQNGLSPVVHYNLGKITAPRVGATGGNFQDSQPDRYTIGGDLKIDRGVGHVSQFGIDDVYKVFLGQYNLATNTVSVVGSQIGSDVNYRNIDQNGQLTATIPTMTLDKSTSHFMIFTARDKQNIPGQKVIQRSSFNMAINDNGYFPRFAPEALGFIDEDKVADSISGTFEITPAMDESFIDNYAIYFGTDDFTRVDTTGRRSNAQGFIGAITLGTTTRLEMEETVHGVKSGELITFTGVGGTTELNNNDYFAQVDSANAHFINLFTDAGLSVPLDSSTFTAHVANTGIINHGVSPISDDDLAEVSRPVSSVAIPDQAIYYMAFSKNGAGESRSFAVLEITDPAYPPKSGEIILIEKNKPKVVEVT